MPNPYDPKFGYSYEEIRILQAHDQGEELHAYMSKGEEPSHLPADETDWWQCKTCGDDSSGLMHNNTWRNVDVLLELEWHRTMGEAGMF